ncbi:MAG: P63C domain-containing protein [Candidatus Angelobacter sp.]
MTDDISGKAKGGFARAESLSQEERSKIAKKGAMARWNPGEIPRAEYTGNLKIGDMSFPCSVLSDGTRILTQSDFMKGMGMYYSGWVARNRTAAEDSAEVPHFLSFKSLKPFVDRHLGDLQSIILKYRTASGGTAHGIKAEIIPKICEIWLDAEEGGKLGVRQKQIAAKAKLLMRSLAHVGIIALVDEATGYQGVRPKDALQMYLEKIIRKELAAWAKKFPDEFYENIYKLKNWPWPGMKKNRYSVVAYYTRDLVYERLAPGLLHELEGKTPKNEKGQRGERMHQWLTEDVGDPMLAQHIHSLLMFQRLALKNGYGWHRFVKMVDQVMPKKGTTLDLPFPPMSEQEQDN